MTCQIRRIRAIGLLFALAALWAVPSANATPGQAQVRDYDLGVVELPDAGPKGPISVSDSAATTASTC
jgi:hypothetical protein